MANFVKGASAHVESLQQNNKVIFDRVSQEDLPLGTTPRKRVWQYVENWELTGKREALLQLVRDRGTGSLASPASEVPQVEHLPANAEVDSDPLEDDPEEQQQSAKEPKPDTCSYDVDTEPVYPDFSPTSSRSSLEATLLPSRTRLRKATNIDPLVMKSSASQPLLDSRTTNTVPTRASRRKRR